MGGVQIACKIVHVLNGRQFKHISNNLRYVFYDLHHKGINTVKNIIMERNMICQAVV